MSLLGRACVSRRVYTTTSFSSSRQHALSLSCCLTRNVQGVAATRHFASATPAGGNLVSESSSLSNAPRPSSHQTGRKGGSWSAWEVAAATFLAAAASASMIAYHPTSVQNEPSVDAAAAASNAPPLQRHSVTIVQRAPNRSSFHKNMMENQQQHAVDEETNSFTDEMETQNQQVVSGGKAYDVSVRAVKGNRVSMEDEFFVTNGGRFAAVFDGHGGGGVSAWLRSQLYGLSQHFLKETHWEEQEDDKDDRKPSLSAHVAALRKAFMQVEKDVVEQETLAYQGSTAVAVVMHESDDGHRTLISANVGDSRAILSRRGKAIDLTRDHKPNEEREKARILNMGEAIEWDSLSKVHRVRNLSLSRAIGDRYAKPVVSSQVEIKLFPVAEDGDEFFLLASDGLWDVMTSQEVVSFVHQRFEKELKREQLQTLADKENMKLVLRRNMARAVAREALRRGTGDNVCVLIVWMQDLKGGKE